MGKQESMEDLCTGRSYKVCITYEGNEHLVGTDKKLEE